MACQGWLGLRKNNDKSGASRWGIVDVGPAAECRRMLGDEGEAEPCSLSMAGGTPTSETFKNSCSIRWVNSVTCVVNHDDYIANSLGINGDSGGASCMNVSVFDEVRKNSLISNAIGDGDYGFRRYDRKGCCGSR